MAVIAVTGGGSEAPAQLLTVPGASRTVMEALVPYHPSALAEFLGGRPDQACSAKTARAMAMAAFQRAMKLEPDIDLAYPTTRFYSLGEPRPVAPPVPPAEGGQADA